MAVAVTRVGNRTVFGDKHVGIFDLAFSGNYATGGEALTGTTLGFPLGTIEYFSPDGAAFSTDRATANVVKYDYATSKVVFYESGGANAASAEKTNAEAYPTGSSVRVLVIGV